jgi:hypothetical protein
VNKGRKIWHGIGLRLDTDPPDEADDRSPGEQSADDRSPGESGVAIGNTPGGGGGGERSEPTNHKVPLENPRVYKESRKRFTSFTSFTDEEKAAGGGPENNSTNSQTHTEDPDTANEDMFAEMRRRFHEGEAE